MILAWVPVGVLLVGGFMKLLTWVLEPVGVELVYGLGLLLAFWMPTWVGVSGLKLMTPIALGFSIGFTSNFSACEDDVLSTD